MRALAGLMGESQIKREDVVIIGVACAGVYGGGSDPAEHPLRATIARSAASAPCTSPKAPMSLSGPSPSCRNSRRSRSRGAGAHRGDDPGRALGLLEGAFLPLHQVHGLPPGLPVLLLRAVPVRQEPPPGGGELAPAGRQHGLAHRARHAPGRALRRLRRVRAGLPDGHPAEPPEPAHGAGAEGAYDYEAGTDAAGEGAAGAATRKTTTSRSSSRQGLPA